MSKLGFKLLESLIISTVVTIWAGMCFGIVRLGTAIGGDYGFLLSLMFVVMLSICSVCAVSDWAKETKKESE